MQKTQSKGTNYENVKRELELAKQNALQNINSDFGKRLEALNLVFNVPVGKSPVAAEPKVTVRRRKRIRNYGELTNKVMEFVGKQDRDFTATEVKKALGGSAPSISATLWRLAHEKKVNIVTGGKGRRATIYRKAA